MSDGRMTERNGAAKFRTYITQSREGNHWGQTSGRPTPEGMQIGAMLRCAEALEGILEFHLMRYRCSVSIEEGATYDWHERSDCHFAWIVVSRFITQQGKDRGRQLPARCERVHSWLTEHLRHGYPLRLPDPRSVYKKPSKARDSYRKWLRLPSGVG